jgi:hypothetical protein
MYIMCQSRRQEMKEAMQDVVRAKLESVRVELEGWAMAPWGRLGHGHGLGGRSCAVAR